MKYLVIVLLCSSGTPIQRCTIEPGQHLDKIVAPEVQTNLGSCMIHGQQYLSVSHLMRPGDFAKIVCRPLEQRVVG